MPVQIIIDSPNGATAAMELLQLVGTLRGYSPTKDEEEPAPVVKPATTKPDAPEPDKKPEEPVKEDKGEVKTATRSRSKAKPEEPAANTNTPAAETPKTEEAKPAEFAAPEGFNDVVKDSGKAPDDVIKAAKDQVDRFAPKEGEPVVLNYCRALLLYMAATKGMDANRKMLETFGIKKVQDLAVDRLGDFATKMKEELSL